MHGDARTIPKKGNLKRKKACTGVILGNTPHQPWQTTNKHLGNRLTAAPQIQPLTKEAKEKGGKGKKKKKRVLVNPSLVPALTLHSKLGSFSKSLGAQKKKEPHVLVLRTRQGKARQGKKKGVSTDRTCLLTSPSVRPPTPSGPPKEPGSPAPRKTEPREICKKASHNSGQSILLMIPAPHGTVRWYCRGFFHCGGARRLLVGETQLSERSLGCRA